MGDDLIFTNGELLPIDHISSYAADLIINMPLTPTTNHLVVNTSIYDWMSNWVNLIDEQNSLSDRMKFLKNQRIMLSKIKKHNRRIYLKQVKSYLKS